MNRIKTTPQPYGLTLHFDRPRFADMVKVESAEDVDRFMRDRIDTGRINHKEFFWIIVTTRANRVLGLREVSSGTTGATAVPFKEIAQVCLLANASGCILVHNHPSGNLKPSECDLHVTRRAKKVLDLIEVSLLDHLIITQESHFSFVENGLLPPA